MSRAPFRLRFSALPEDVTQLPKALGVVNGFAMAVFRTTAPLHMIALHYSLPGYCEMHADGEGGLFVYPSEDYPESELDRILNCFHQRFGSFSLEREGVPLAEEMLAARFEVERVERSLYGYTASIGRHFPDLRVPIAALRPGSPASPPAAA